VGGGAGRPKDNLYNSAGNRDRVASSNKQRDAGLNKANRVSKGPNNVYADRNGTAHRQNSNGSWQSRGSNGSWNRSSSGSNMSRDASARSRGGSYGGSRGGGGMRGGGGRGGGRR
jgi:hypothetical protein